MFDGVANRHAESEEEDQCASVERRSKYDISDRPAVFERAEDENQLQYNIDGHADERPDEVDNEKSERFRVVEAKLLLECGDGDKETNSEHDETGDAKELVWINAKWTVTETRARRPTQRDSGVPSSANWKPTKPFMSKQVYIDATRPVYIAENH